MVDSILSDAYQPTSAGAGGLDARNRERATALLDDLLGLQVAFNRCTTFAVDPSLSDAERAEFATLSTAAFGVVRSMVGPSLCLFLKLLHTPGTSETTRDEARSYLLGFLKPQELDTLSEDELCSRLLSRLRARGFPVSEEAMS